MRTSLSFRASGGAEAPPGVQFPPVADSAASSGLRKIAGSREGSKRPAGSPCSASLSASSPCSSSGVALVEMCASPAPPGVANDASTSSNAGQSVRSEGRGALVGGPTGGVEDEARESGFRGSAGKAPGDRSEGSEMPADPGGGPSNREETDSEGDVRRDPQHDDAAGCSTAAGFFEPQHPPLVDGAGPTSTLLFLLAILPSSHPFPVPQWHPPPLQAPGAGRFREYGSCVAHPTHWHVGPQKHARVPAVGGRNSGGVGKKAGEAGPADEGVDHDWVVERAAKWLGRPAYVPASVEGVERIGMAQSEALIGAEGEDDEVDATGEAAVGSGETTMSPVGSYCMPRLCELCSSCEVQQLGAGAWRDESAATTVATDFSAGKNLAVGFLFDSQQVHLPPRRQLHGFSNRVTGRDEKQSAARTVDVEFCSRLTSAWFGPRQVGSFGVWRLDDVGDPVRKDARDVVHCSVSVGRSATRARVYAEKRCLRLSSLAAQSHLAWTALVFLKSLQCEH